MLAVLRPPGELGAKQPCKHDPKEVFKLGELSNSGLREMEGACNISWEKPLSA